MLKITLRAYLLTIVSAILFALSATRTLAWDNDPTHKDLSRIAADNSTMNAGYITSTLGLPGGLDENLHWDGGEEESDNTISLWLQEGADFEDSDSRFFKHFHNPLSQSPWTDAGLSDLVLFRQQSSLLWAQDTATNPDWAWQTARQHFYDGLTAESDTLRSPYPRQHV